MSAVTWVPGAERLTPSLPGGNMQDGPAGPPRAVWHTTEAPPGVPAMFDRMRQVLTSKGAEPHILIDPITDRMGQFIPLNLSCRALRNDGATRNNRVGPACIQIEVIAHAAEPFTDLWQPGPNWRALMAAIRSWDIPDVFPAGPPPRYIDGRGNVPPDPRSRSVWLTKAGHFGHSQVPGNDHGDPGAVDVFALFAGPSPTQGDLTMSDVSTILDAIAAQARLDAARYSDLATRGQRTEAALKALAEGVGPTIAKAVEDALAASVDVTGTLTVTPKGA